MPIIPRSLDDLIIDSMVTALRAFSTQQVAIDSKVGFTVDRDRLQAPTMNEMPFVNIWLDNSDPKPEGSSAKLTEHVVTRINVDCYAKGEDTNSDGLDDKKAMARLHYLKEQVKYGLYKLINADFGQTIGSIGRKKWPRWQSFPNDLPEPETEVVAGRWAIEIEYTWTPEDITGIELDQITVDSDRWSAAYNYGE